MQVNVYCIVLHVSGSVCVPYGLYVLCWTLRLMLQLLSEEWYITYALYPRMQYLMPYVVQGSRLLLIAKSITDVRTGETATE